MVNIKTKINLRNKPRKFENKSHIKRVEFKVSRIFFVLILPQETSIVFTPFILSPSISRRSKRTVLIKHLIKIKENTSIIFMLDSGEFTIGRNVPTTAQDIAIVMFFNAN